MELNITTKSYKSKTYTTKKYTIQLLNQKGITLIALVVTIVVLLILAGVSLNAVFSDEGIIKQAQKVQEKWNNAEKSDLEGIKGLEEILDEYTEDTSKANSPRVEGIANKTYVTWSLNEKKTEYVINDTQTTEPNKWYNYDNGKWANIKTTNEGLEAYWVWIPRYEYIVPTSTTATKIEVKFIPTTKIEPDKGYTIHPAFTNEGNGGLGELDGIWVAKYEASSNSSSPDTTYGGGDDTSLKVQVKPNVQSWRNITAKNILTVCQAMTSTGGVLDDSTNVDSHMMKNTEWGAVAILSQSKYGTFNPTSNNNGQVWNNPNGYNSHKNIYTGYAGESKDAFTESSLTTASTNIYAYNTINGTKASTTGTVYGVYDMAAGSYEYVAGCLSSYENTLFGVTTGDSMYVDLYINSTDKFSNYEAGKIGDATKETKDWNNDAKYFINSTYPVVTRGNVYDSKQRAGVFCFFAATGKVCTYVGFRPILTQSNVS